MSPGEGYAVVTDEDKWQESTDVVQLWQPGVSRQLSQQFMCCCCGISEVNADELGVPGGKDERPTRGGVLMAV